MARRKRQQIQPEEKYVCLYFGAYGTMNVDALLEVELVFDYSKYTDEKEPRAVRILFWSNTEQSHIIDVYETRNLYWLDYMVAKRTDILIGFEDESFDVMRNREGWDWPKCSKKFEREYAERQTTKLIQIEEQELMNVGC